MANMLKESRAELKHAWSDIKHIRKRSKHSFWDKVESETLSNKQFQKKSNKYAERWLKKLEMRRKRKDELISY